MLAVAAIFRFYDLGLKPPHFDEGINGHFVMTIWRDGFYSYDPTNFHGPLYFYLCHLAEILFGRGVESFRIMNAGLGVLLIYGIIQFRRFVGQSAIWAAWILALSPAFTFYGRYAIHETLFIIGQILFIYGRFAWMSRPDRLSLILIACGVVILLATKETFFIFLGTWAIAEVMIAGLERIERSHRPWTSFSSLGKLEQWGLAKTAVAIGGISVGVLAALFSGFFQHSEGITNFFRAFQFWSATGTAGNGHEKPFYYWLELAWQYELPLLIGLLVSVFATLQLRSENRKQRLLLLAGLGHFLAYSIVPYKTPWLILNFWLLAFFSFGGQKIGTWSYPRFMQFSARVAMTVLIALGAVRSWRLNFRNFADAREPYVYVQTTSDYTAVMGLLREKISKSPDFKNSVIVVMVKDPWPLPYDLSLFPNMRYAKLEDVDKDPKLLNTADLVLIDGSLLEGLQKVFPKKFGRIKFQLRDAYLPGWALFDYDKFQSVLPKDVALEEATQR